MLDAARSQRAPSTQQIIRAERKPGYRDLWRPDRRQHLVFLAIDVGNTNVHIGLAPDLEAPWERTFRFSSSRDRTADEWHALLDVHFEKLRCDNCQVVMCSV